MERRKRRDRLYRMICRLKEHTPEPSSEEDHCSTGRQEPEAKVQKTLDNNNNTFTWSGPSGALAAPNNGP
jgi:hypothetical protein